jgi:hypothetical protein
MNYVMLIVATVFGVGLYVFALQRPQQALVLWLATVCFVPDWTTVHAGPLALSPSSAVGIPLVIGLIAGRLFSADRMRHVRIAFADWALLGAGVLIIAQNDLAFLNSVLAKEFVLVWVVAYTLGRASGPSLQRALVVMLSIVAAWGVLEFAFDIHVFEFWSMSSSHHWNAIQERAGVARSEATFGHAIAYGAALALAIPFTRLLSDRWALLAQIVLAAGVVVSLSRGPMLSLIVALALTAVFLAGGAYRIRMLMLTAVGGITVYGVLQFLYSGPFSDEVQQSGAQRTNQLLATIDRLNWLSPSRGFSFQSGRYSVGDVDVIDSTPLRLAVNFGIVAAVLILVPVVFAALSLLTNRAGVATIALVGQIPALLVTSLITQWTVLIFFAMGMAVTEMARRHDSDRDRRYTTSRDALFASKAVHTSAI